MTGTAPSREAAAAARLTRIGMRITLVSLAALAVVYVLAIWRTPTEAAQGFAQKIFYLHVPAAWCALLIFSVVGIVSALYLWLKDARLDHFAAAAAETGVAFSAVMLTSGPLWGKPVWGAWWQWDARLTLTLFLFFLYVGYLSLRSALHDPAERARFSAVVAILGLVLVPFVHLSVYLFRTIHPLPVVLKPSAPSLPGSMLEVLLLSLGVHMLLGLGFVLARYGIARAEAARLEVSDG
ncbi:MAG TPA: cytochrome c biogenesis protein CcsA [Gemmatimonadales bacterium]